VEITDLGTPCCADIINVIAASATTISKTAATETTARVVTTATVTTARRRMFHFGAMCRICTNKQ
jgi:hypothetical protein